MKEENILISDIENWLCKPYSKSIEQSISTSNVLLKEINKEVNEDDSLRKSLGPFIGKVKGVQKQLNQLEILNWVSFSNGFISIGHRPSQKLGSDLKLQNTTHILTLLSEKEGAKTIEKICKQNSMEWL